LTLRETPDRRDRVYPDAGVGARSDTGLMPNIRKPRVRGIHAPQPVMAVTLGLGLAYLATLATFALAFERPSARGWGGFAIVAVVVLAVTVGIGQFLARSRWTR
jgi:hypothetical protein